MAEVKKHLVIIIREIRFYFPGQFSPLSMGLGFSFARLFKEQVFQNIDLTCLNAAIIQCLKQPKCLVLIGNGNGDDMSFFFYKSYPSRELRCPRAFGKSFYVGT